MMLGQTGFCDRASFETTLNAPIPLSAKSRVDECIHQVQPLTQSLPESVLPPKTLELWLPRISGTCRKTHGSRGPKAQGLSHLLEGPVAVTSSLSSGPRGMTAQLGLSTYTFKNAYLGDVSPQRL